MSEPRKKPGVAFWATVVVVVALVGYPLSFGVAAWLVDRGDVAARPAARLYWPILFAMHSRPGFVREGFYSLVRRVTKSPQWTVIRMMEAAGLSESLPGVDPRHDVPHKSSEHWPFRS